MFKYNIITPCSKQDKYRIQKLASNLSKQDYHNFEWIICSDNHTIKYLKHKIHNNLHICFVTCNNHTVGSFRNAALAKSNCKYLIFIDADDYLLRNNVLSSVNAVVDEYPGSNVFNLHSYRTFEPESTYLHVKHISKNPPYFPQWGGKHKKDPAKNKNSFKIPSYSGDNGNIKVNYSILCGCSAWLYMGLHRYDKMRSQLCIRGKVIPYYIVKKYHARFNAKNPLYSSYSFLLPIICHTKKFIVMSHYNYVDVRHNDSVNDPSLHQITTNKRWELLFKAYQHVNISKKKVKFSFDNYILRHIDNKFYKDVVANKLTVANNLVPTLTTLSQLLRQIDNLTVKKSVSKASAKVLHNIKIGYYQTAKRQVTHLMNMRMINNAIHHKGRHNLAKISYRKFIHRPIKSHTIMFESFLGRSFSDNPKYIFLYMYHHYHNQFHFVWSADTNDIAKLKSDLHPFSHTKVVKRFGIKYAYYLATSKYFVYNMRQPRWFIKRHGMHFLETWHGTPLKRLVFDMKYVAGASHNYKRIFYHQSRQWDALLADNQFSYQHLSHAFMYPEAKIYKSGYPRNDILSTKNNRHDINKIKRSLGIPLNKKVILYAPTWRDNKFIGHGEYTYHLHLDLNLLRQHLGNKYVLLLRTHYFVVNHIDTSPFGNFVKDVSDYSDISELYLISDILITDYSSVFFDFANLKRPILFFVYDYDFYAKILHGFYLSMRTDLPGPLLKNSSEVLDAIMHYGKIKDKYRKRYHQFNKRFNNWDDGNSAKFVSKKFFKLS